MTTFNRNDIGLRAPEPGPGALNPVAVDGVALHWPATSTPIRGVDDVMAALRDWQDYHMDTKGWSDIAYQVAVDQDGNRYLLRGLSVQSAANGDTDVNERFGAVLLILAAGEQPSAAMVAETQRVVADHRALFPNSSQIVGHAEIRPGGTECPGPIVLRLIDEGAFTPPVEEGDMPTPDDLLNEPLNAFDPNGNPATANVTVREALSAFVIFIREGAPAAKTYLDKAGESPAAKE